jgi:hypothetical protein
LVKELFFIYGILTEKESEHLENASSFPKKEVTGQADTLFALSIFSYDDDDFVLAAFPFQFRRADHQ